MLAVSGPQCVLDATFLAMTLLVQCLNSSNKARRGCINHFKENRVHFIMGELMGELSVKSKMAEVEDSNNDTYLSKHHFPMLRRIPQLLDHNVLSNGIVLLRNIKGIL